MRERCEICKREGKDRKRLTGQLVTHSIQTEWKEEEEDSGQTHSSASPQKGSFGRQTACVTPCVVRKKREKETYTCPRTPMYIFTVYAFFRTYTYMYVRAEENV